MEEYSNKQERENEEKIAGVPDKENPGHSTLETPNVTGNYTETERRVGSATVRTGAIDAKKAADEIGK
jgi:hypothetical protein